VTTASQPRAARGRRSSRPTGDDREQAILATMARLLEQRSYREISVDDLARGAGLSRPTFYFYFRSKEAVLVSLIEPLVERLTARFDEVAERLADDPRAVVHEGIKAFFTAFNANRAIARAGTESLATSAEVRAVWSGFMQRWIEATAAVIEAERARGAAPVTVPAHDLATALNQMNERTMMAVLTGETPAVPEDELVETLTHIWVSAIYGPGA